MKKAIGLFILMIIIFLNIFTIPTNAISMSSADLYSKGIFNGLLKWGDIRLESNYVVYQKDGVEYPAYCLQRELEGVTQGDAYTVSVDSLVNNAMVWRTIINGYPYKSISELGCQTKEEAFFATKQAVYCILYNRDVSEYSALSPEGERCLNALKQIVDSARNSNISKVYSDISIESTNSLWQIDNLDGKYISKEFLAKSNAPLGEYTVTISGDIPEGTKIVDLENKDKTVFKSSEKFKIIIPLTNVLKDGFFNVGVSRRS